MGNHSFKSELALDKNITDFQKIALPWARLQNKIKISVVGVKSGDELLIASARISALLDINDKEPEKTFESEMLWGRSLVLPLKPSQIDTLIKNATCGNINIGAVSSLPLEANTDDFSYYFEDNYRSQLSGSLTQPRRLSLSIKGQMHRNAIRNKHTEKEIDNHLMSLDMPFSGLRDFYNYFDVPITDDSIIEICVDGPVLIDSDSKLEGESAKFIIRAAPEFNKDKLHIGFISHSEDSSRGKIPGIIFDWIKSDGRYHGSFVKDLVTARSLQCFAVYDGVVIQRFWLHNNDRQIYKPRAIYSAFDPGYEELKDRLFFCEKKHSRTFEDAVSVLLGLLGFTVSHYGSIPGIAEDAPDIVAMCGQNSILVLECTLGLPDKGDQISKVIQRAELVKSALKSSGWENIRVKAVIVTNLQEAYIRVPIDEAKNRGVAVIFKEKLDDYIEKLYEPLNPAEIYESIAKSSMRQITDSIGSMNWGD